MLVCSLQLAAWQDETKEQRMAKAEDYFRQIGLQKQRPAQILLPEIWGTGYLAFDNYKREAEAEQGDTYDLISAWAKRLNCYILSGSFVEKEGDAYYNTNLLLSPQGRLMGKYRKIHLFNYQSREGAILKPGTDLTVIKTEYGKVGIATCFDLRFPEFFRMMINLGAEIFLVSSAWPLARLEHWQLFNRVRAIENQSFLISCNAAGNQTGQQMAGHSMIISPTGEAIACGSLEEAQVYGDIDLYEIQACRKSFPALSGKVLI